MADYTDTIFLCERVDIIDRFGGAEWLTKALDPHQTGTYDTAIFDRARADAAGDVMSAAGNKAKLWEQGTVIPQWVVTLTARRAVVYCWDYGTHGMVRPDGVQKMYEEGEVNLANLREGKTGTGPTEPKNRNTIRDIDNSNGGERFVFSSFRNSRWR